MDSKKMGLVYKVIALVMAVGLFLPAYSSWGESANYFQLAFTAFEQVTDCVFIVIAVIGIAVFTLAPVGTKNVRIILGIIFGIIAIIFIVRIGDALSLLASKSIGYFIELLGSIAVIALGVLAKINVIDVDI